MTVLKIAILIIGGYLLGNFSSAKFLSRLKKDDITKHGSGNPGTMNMLRTFGFKFGALTLLMDALKGAIPSLTGFLMFGGTSGGELAYIGLFIGGVAAIIGHIFPVFSNFTDNRNCGNGDPTNGDITGWINRGINWKLIQDTPKRYEIDLIASHPDIKYPVTASVTIRRRQSFRFAPGTELAFEYGTVKGKVKISQEGLLTIPDVRFDSKAPVRLTISK